MTKFVMLAATIALSFGGTAIGEQSERAATQVWKASAHYEKVEKHTQGKPRERRSSTSTIIEVTEWFWLGCPHCYALEPHVVNWEGSLPKDVALKRIAVGWDMPERVAHAKLYYALEVLGRSDLRQAAFDTIHRDKDRLFVPGDESQTAVRLRAFAQLHGLDPDSFMGAYTSSAAQDYVADANRQAVLMHVGGVPAISVNGRYTTTVSKAGGVTQLFQLLDYLVDKERRGLEP